jgi:hypothetical protein
MGSSSARVWNINAHYCVRSLKIIAPFWRGTLKLLLSEILSFLPVYLIGTDRFASANEKIFHLVQHVYQTKYPRCVCISSTLAPCRGHALKIIDLHRKAVSGFKAETKCWHWNIWSSSETKNYRSSFRTNRNYKRFLLCPYILYNERS